MRALFLPALVAASVLAASAAWACSCVRYESAAQQLAQADVMFTGRVVSATNHALGDDHPESWVTTRFEVRRTIKGEAQAEQVVLHATDMGGNCGVQFVPGQDYTVIAHRRPDGALTTSSCSAPQFPLADYEQAARR